MDKKRLWDKKLKNIKNMKDDEGIKIELYSIFISMILSKEEFKNNIEIKELFKELNIEVRPYIFKSRTALVGKIVRVIERADYDMINFCINVLENRIALQVAEKKKSESEEHPKKKEEYMKGILKKYARGKKE